MGRKAVIAVCVMVVALLAFGGTATAGTGDVGTNNNCQSIGYEGDAVESTSALDDGPTLMCSCSDAPTCW